MHIYSVEQSFIMTAGVRQPWSLSAFWGASSSVLHYPLKKEAKSTQTKTYISKCGFSTWLISSLKCFFFNSGYNYDNLTKTQGMDTHRIIFKTTQSTRKGQNRLKIVLNLFKRLDLVVHLRWLVCVDILNKCFCKVCVLPQWNWSNKNHKILWLISLHFHPKYVLHAHVIFMHCIQKQSG